MGRENKLRNGRKRKKDKGRKLRSWSTELKLLLKSKTENKNKMENIKIRITDYLRSSRKKMYNIQKNNIYELSTIFRLKMAY